MFHQKWPNVGLGAARKQIKIIGPIWALFTLVFGNREFLTESNMQHFQVTMILYNHLNMENVIARFWEKDKKTVLEPFWSLLLQLWENKSFTLKPEVFMFCYLYTKVLVFGSALSNSLQFVVNKNPSKTWTLHHFSIYCQKLC